MSMVVKTQDRKVPKTIKTKGSRFKDLRRKDEVKRQSQKDKDQRSPSIKEQAYNVDRDKDKDKSLKPTAISMNSRSSAKMNSLWGRLRVNGRIKCNLTSHVYRAKAHVISSPARERNQNINTHPSMMEKRGTPKTSHLQAVKRIFRYLKGQLKLSLWYSKVSSFDLEAYSDSDYASANLDRKSTTEGCQFFGRRLISWQCKKQTIMATSTTKTTYVAAAHYCGQVLWIQNQLLNYGFNFMNTKFYINNESTICIVKNPVFHSKTKHIEIRHYFIRDAYEKKLIQVLKIYTDDNVADLLTKAFDGSSKELASPKQIACNEALAIPEQTATDKEISNPFMAGSLPKTT
nr:putative ribonuclease H-like domain-containing protein [Tanacetum cinerariifolium]